MNNFYVYCHQRLDTGKCFYIGKGVKYRAYSKHRRNPHWNNIVKKCGGFDVKILVNNISEEKALELEIDFIKQIGLENLCNMTEGGEGNSGFNHSIETRKKMSESKKGKTNSAKSIIQYSKNNEFIKEWSSAAESGKVLNIDRSYISKCARNKAKTAGGFIWKYK